MIHSRKTGFTLIELMLSLAILAILAALAVPFTGDSNALRLDSARRLIASDVEHTQILAITHPQTEYALVIHGDGSGWHIALTGDPQTAVLDSVTGDPLLVTIGDARGAPALGVVVTTNAMDNIISFDPNGGLTEFSIETSITLRIGTSQSVISISTATGSLTYE